jgi:hypothetical protein
MKNKLFLAGMLAMTFGLVLAGCPTEPDDEEDGGIIVVADLEAQLKALAANDADDTPHTFVLPAITISGTDRTGSDWSDVNTAVENAQRYVILDLSRCTFTNNTVVGHYSGGLLGMNTIASNAYIKGIILPESVTSIGKDAFSDCTHLTRIDIPAGVITIGNSAFSRCSALISIDIPAGVTSIELLTFYRCSALTRINIPEGVTSIGVNAFTGCAALTSVTIPAGVASIGANAFNGTALTDVTFAEGSNITSFGSSAFPEGSSGYGGDNLKTAYNAAEPKSGTYTRPENGTTWAKQ